MEKFLHGERQKIEDLVKRYGDALVRYAYCHTGNAAEAEDIAEDAFVALFLKGKTFASEAQTRAYLYKSVRNKCVDYHRSKARNAVSLSDLEDVLYADDAAALIDERCDSQTLYKCMQSLPAQYKEALCLHYFDGFSPAEIAKLLHKPTKSVYNALARARTALSQLLQQEGIS